MFTVKCVVAGTLSIIMEKGSVTLKTGQNFDLEAYCSRHWIKTDRDLQRFIKSGLLVVVFDSADKIAQHPTGNAVSSSSARKPQKTPRSDTIIVDFSNLPDPDELDKLDAYVEGKLDESDLNLSSNYTEEPVEAEPAVEVLPEVSSEEDRRATLAGLKWNDLRSTAKEANISIYKKSADELIAELLEQDK